MGINMNIEAIASFAVAGTTLLLAAATTIDALIHGRKTHLTYGGRESELAKLEATQPHHVEQSWAFGYSIEKLIAYNRLIEDNWLGIVYARQREFHKADEFYRHMLQLIEDAEASWNERFHRGLPLHNLGILAILNGSIETGIEYLISAYIEDFLTAGRAARGWLAAQALTKMGVSPSMLNTTERRIDALKKLSISAHVKHADLKNISLEIAKEISKGRIVPPPEEYTFALFSPETNQDLAMALGKEVGRLHRQLYVHRRLIWGTLFFSISSCMLAMLSLYF
jgi:tetratricopeptide (TPR) repeat protein